MQKYYFNIKYEFNKETVHKQIARQLRKKNSDYICVADGVILSIANRKPEYLKVVNEGMFSICDSGYVPLYIRWIHGIHYEQYCGSQIFMDIVSSKKYRMFFMGTSKETLDGLRQNLVKINPAVTDMTFLELPFRKVEEFDYEGIAKTIEADGADIIWVALGAPKQEIFMNFLKPHLRHGIMIAVGAAFKFFSGNEEKRAPNWMLDIHLEFAYRIMQAPKKQLARCAWIIITLPRLIYQEWKRNRKR